MMSYHGTFIVMISWKLPLYCVRTEWHVLFTMNNEGFRMLIPNRAYNLARFGRSHLAILDIGQQADHRIHIISGLINRFRVRPYSALFAYGFQR